MFDRVLAELGAVDVLVNNAGDIHAARHFLDGDEAWWDHLIDVNLKGAFLCSHRVARTMAERGRGVIIHMSSGGATRAHRGNVAYDASKGGIEAMTRAMALDLAPYGVRVNAIVPGLIRTYDITDEAAVERGKVVPMGRLGSPEDLAGPTVFLATEDARYITGTCLVVDGGVLVQQRSPAVETFPVERFPKVTSLTLDTEELLRRAYAAFNARDIDGALATMHPDVEWPNGMEGGTEHGHAAVRAYWTRQWTTLNPRVEPVSFQTDDGGRVIVRVRQEARDLAGTVLAYRMIEHVFSLDEGRVRAMEIREPGSHVA
jgi:3-oxoacyl-[acyl-carrier protein] reductase